MGYAGYERCFTASLLLLYCCFVQVLMGYAGYERYSEGIAHGKSQVKCIYTYGSIRQHTPAYVSIRQHTSAYVRALQRGHRSRQAPGTQFTCFTSTKVQVLTLAEELLFFFSQGIRALCPMKLNPNLLYKAGTTAAARSLRPHILVA